VGQFHDEGQEHDGNGSKRGGKVCESKIQSQELEGGM